jgi:hypothetical protein
MKTISIYIIILFIVLLIIIFCNLLEVDTNNCPVDYPKSNSIDPNSVEILLDYVGNTIIYWNLLEVDTNNCPVDYPKSNPIDPNSVTTILDPSGNIFIFWNIYSEEWPYSKYKDILYFSLCLIDEDGSCSRRSMVPVWDNFEYNSSKPDERMISYHCMRGLRGNYRAKITPLLTNCEPHFDDSFSKPFLIEKCTEDI